MCFVRILRSRYQAVYRSKWKASCVEGSLDLLREGDFRQESDVRMLRVEVVKLGQLLPSCIW